MPTGNYLTDEDVAVIQAMIDKTLLGIQNQGGNSEQAPPMLWAGETFVARLLVGQNIPGIDIVSDPPVVSFGTCRIYTVNQDDELIESLFRTESIPRKVYNLTPEDITDEDAFFLVTKDKGGKFWYVGGGTCSARNEKWLIQLVGATGSDFEIELVINGVQETITINYDSTAAQVKTAFEAHSELASTDLATEGGPFPGTSINVEFIGDQAGKSILPTSITNNLAGTGAKPEIYRWVPGFPE